MVAGLALDRELTERTGMAAIDQTTIDQPLEFIETPNGDGTGCSQPIPADDESAKLLVCEPLAPYLPDVTEMTNADAAAAYAEAGIHIVPVPPGTKNPGGYLWVGLAATGNLTWPPCATGGTAGPMLGSRCTWAGPGFGHRRGQPRQRARVVVEAVGASGFSPDDHRSGYSARTLPLPATRGPSGPGMDSASSAAEGQDLGRGQVRRRRADAGAEHAPEGSRRRCLQFWAGRADPTGTRRDCQLNAAPETDEFRPLTPGELDEQATRFLQAYNDESETHALGPILRNFDPTPGGRPRSTPDTLCWALREAKAGRFGAQRAVHELRELWIKAIGGSCRSDDPDEFNRMVRDAVPVADQQSAEELRARANRNKWPHPKKPQRVAMQVLERARIAFWRSEWLSWDGRCWTPTSEAEMRQHLYLSLKDGWYEHTQSDGSTIALPWRILDKPKVDKVIDALKAEALLPDDTEEDGWSDGRDEPVMPFANGLLRLSDRKLLEHNPDYFCLWHAPCDYDAGAQLSRVERFLKDLTGGDSEAIGVLAGVCRVSVCRRQRVPKDAHADRANRFGQGTFDKLLEAVIGNRHAGVQLDDFRNNGFPKEPLLGQSLVTFSDQRVQLNAKKFTDLLLQVTGGDKMSVRLPYDLMLAVAAAAVPVSVPQQRRAGAAGQLGRVAAPGHHG